MACSAVGGALEQHRTRPNWRTVVSAASEGARLREVCRFALLRLPASRYTPSACLFYE